MRKSAILQAGLVTGNKDPVVIGATEQGATLGGERLALLRIRNLRQIGIEVLGAVVRCADMDETAVNALIGADVAQPGFLSGRELTEPAPQDVVLG